MCLGTIMTAYICESLPRVNTVLSALQGLSHSVLLKYLLGRWYYPHFTVMETEVDWS